MIHIQASSLFTVIRALDLPPENRAEAIDIAVGQTEDHVRHLPGFVGASWWTRRPPGPDDGGPARVVEYTQWRRRADFRTFRDDPVKSEHLTRTAALAVGHHSESYQVDRVISADPSATLDVFAEDRRLTIVMLFMPKPGMQGWLTDYNQCETRRFIQDLDGFVGVAFHLGHTTDRMAEVAQWESPEAFRAASAHPGFAEHVRVLQHYTDIDGGDYDSVHSIDAPARRAAAADV